MNTVTTTIIVNGKTIDTATSEGAFVIATASGSAGERKLMKAAWLLLLVIMSGCAEITLDEIRPIAADWCRQERGGEPGCVDAQIDAIRHLRELVPNRAQREQEMMKCGYAPSWWMDYTLVDRCITQRLKILARARNQPLEFEIADSAFHDTWGRAQSWIARHSGRKIQTVTDFLIETYGPQTAEPGANYFAYQVVRSPLGGERSKISISCTPTTSYYAEVASDNSHILALYVATGDKDAE